MPKNLHWFKWEAYTTLITGAFLMALIYWYQAEIYLIDPSVMALSKPVAIVIGVLTLVIGWLGYDALCKSRIGQKENVMAAVLVVALTIIAWGLCQLFSGRGAYMHFGAMLGTIMVANVYFVIMPGQRAMVAANSDGQQPDPVHGIRAKQRSVHNTYFTQSLKRSAQHWIAGFWPWTLLQQTASNMLYYTPQVMCSYTYH